MLVQVAELDVVLLGAVVPVGMTTFTWLLESDPPASVMLIPGVGNGTEPRVWKRPGIVKLVLVPTVGGAMKNPLSVVLEVPAFRSKSLVMEILLTVIVVELRNSSEGVMVPTG